MMEEIVFTAAPALALKSGCWKLMAAATPRHPPTPFARLWALE